MKTYFIFYLFLIILFINCGDHETEGPDANNIPDTLCLSESKIIFSAKGGEKTFDIKSNTDWFISNNSSWFQVDISKGAGNSKIKLTAQSNTDYEDKFDSLVVYTDQVSQSLFVVLNKLNAIILDQNEFAISQEKQEVKVEVRSNVTYEVKIKEEDKDWVKMLPTKALESSFVYFQIQANETYEERLAKIVIEDVDKSIADTVYLNQAPKKDMIITKKLYEVKPEGEDIEIEIQSNIEYKCIIDQKYSSWIQQNAPSKALEQKKLTFTVSPNNTQKERYGEIIFDSGNHFSDTVKIKQGISDIYIGNITLSTLEEIEDFKKKGYKKITGTLTIQNDEIITLAALDNQLDSIGFGLVIACKNLEKFEGLYGLKTIGEDFFLSGCKIRQFEGLNNLTSIAGNFNLDGRDEAFPNLSSFKGLNKLKKIGKNFKFWTSKSMTFNALESFEGLEGLETIGGDFILEAEASSSITDFNALKSFNGLNSLNYIAGDFIIRANASSEVHCYDALASFDGLDQLEQIGGNFSISCSIYSSSNEYSDFMSALSSFKGLNKLTRIGKSLELMISGRYIFGFSRNIETFEGLNELSEIGGDFIIQGSFDIGSPAWNKITSFQGLEKLSLIGGNFQLAAQMNALKSFTGLSNLKTIGGNFSLRESFQNLISFSGLNTLQTIGGDFNLYSSIFSDYTGSTFCKLESFEGLNQLTSIGGNFELVQAVGTSTSKAFEALKSFKGLEKLAVINGSFNLKTDRGGYFSEGAEMFNALESFEGLNGLTIIKKNFYCGVSVETTYNVDKASFSMLKNFKGLENLSSIGEDFTLYAAIEKGFESLQSFEGLENLKTINGTFQITGIAKNSYTTCESFKNLTSFMGLTSLNFIGKDFKPNLYQISYSGLENLQQIGGSFDIKVSNLINLGKLREIGGNLTITNEKITTLEGLTSLETIKEKLTIENCKELTNIDALSSLKFVNEINIIGNSKLSDYCVFKDLLKEFSGTFHTFDNKYDPTIYQILNGNCAE